jgi:flavin-dependent dehydrogenase
MERYDAIVIGLGPGGAVAAHNMAEAGLKVLVLSGNGGHKPCGGALSERWRFLFERLNAPEWLWKHEVRQVTLAAPGQNRSPGLAGAPGPTWWSGSAWTAGWPVRPKTPEPGWCPARAESLQQTDTGVEVKANGDFYKADWLIGADGASGITARTLKLKSHAHRFAALVEERPMPEHLEKQLNGGVLVEIGGIGFGYGWLFARGGTLNLGMGSWGWRAGTKPPGMKKAYTAFLQRYGLGEPGRYRGAAIPTPSHSAPVPCQGAHRSIG